MTCGSFILHWTSKYLSLRLYIRSVMENCTYVCMVVEFSGYDGVGCPLV